jgi:hypothetical protein
LWYLFVVEITAKARRVLKKPHSKKALIYNTQHTTHNTVASMACAAIALAMAGLLLTCKQECRPSYCPDVDVVCSVQLPAALRAQMATEGDHSEWMHDSGAGNKHISPPPPAFRMPPCNLPLTALLLLSRTKIAAPMSCSAQPPIIALSTTSLL